LLIVKVADRLFRVMINNYNFIIIIYMPGFIKMNLWNPKITNTALKREPLIKSKKVPAVNLKSNSRFKMDIVGLKNTKPCGRCGGS
jgi:hypothetical protein